MVGMELCNLQCIFLGPPAPQSSIQQQVLQSRWDIVRGMHACMHEDSVYVNTHMHVDCMHAIAMHLLVEKAATCPT